MQARKTPKPRAVFLAALFLFAACSSGLNTVRFVAARDGAPAYLRLKTQHYVTLGGNLVEEYQRGKRAAVCILKADANKKEDIDLKIEISLYEDDPPVRGRAWLEVGAAKTPIEILESRAEKTEEMAAVLDTGQRDEFLPPMSNDVQAQSEYITFGKPAGAGGVRRTWTVYSLGMKIPRETLAALRGTEKATFAIAVGNTGATFALDGEARMAWLRLSAGEYP